MTKELVTKKTEWLCSIQPGETKIGYFSSYQELNTMSTLISRFNKGIGFEKGLYITGKRDWNNLAYIVTCCERH